ncbi:winged helix-turn-helix domain-containing protein [Chloroflexota bacterium]
MYSKIEAALIILKEQRKPMTARDMVRIAIEKKMIETKGKTPASTMGADFFNENKRRQGKNLPPRFSNLGGGLWSLTEWGLPPIPQVKNKNKPQ